MNDKKVLVRKKGHANLDSFPFRYGFTKEEDFHLLIQYNSKPIEQNQDKGKCLRINDASFLNPTNKDESLEGTFVISEKNGMVVTVIRQDEGVEKTLSKALKIFREYGYVKVNELIDYFHPLYINGDIKTHQDFKKYWVNKNSNDSEKIAEMEDSLAETYNELDKLQKQLEIEQDQHKNEQDKHNKTKKVLQEKEEVIQEQEEEIRKIRMQLDSINDTSFPTRPVSTRQARLLIDVTLEDMNSRNRGPVKGVVLHFDDYSTLKNNWDGAERRKQVVSQLIGKEVITDVWGSYSASEWFRNVYLA